MENQEKKEDKMSNSLDRESVITNKKEAIKKLNRLLEQYINDSTGNHLKKANLISYWLKDYTRYLSFEEKFNPKRNIAYKRGNVVKVSFGFNLGAEYGGLHYGIVLDNKNDHGSSVVTVIPLTSAKEGQPIHRNNVSIGNELYRLLKIKYDTISKLLKEEEADILNTMDAIVALLKLSKSKYDESIQMNHGDEKKQKLQEAMDHLNKIDELETVWKEKEKHNQEEQRHLEKIGTEINGMKEGSIALVNQITTISKMRIVDPKTARGVLSGISLSSENMDKINNKIKELFVF